MNQWPSEVHDAWFLERLFMHDHRATYTAMTPEQRLLVRFGYAFGYLDCKQDMNKKNIT